jgi:hypothetical protein
MKTRAAAPAELGKVFEMIAAEYRDKGLAFAADNTAILHA